MTTVQENGVRASNVLRRTEIGRSSKFVTKIKNSHCYVMDTNQWHEYHLGCWAPVDQKVVQAQALGFIKDEAQRIARIDDDRDREETEAEYRRYASKAGVNNLAQLAAVELQSNAQEFDTDDEALCAKNGWLNLKDGKLNCHDPSKRFSMSCAAGYATDRSAPLWRKTVNQVFGGNMDLVTYFQRAVGYSLLGGNSEQVLFICHGAGANGKSLLLEAIKDVLGSYAQSLPISTLMRAKINASGASPEIARLRGIRFALASETEKGQRWSANKIKTLTGSDTVATRALYQDMIEFRNKATIWVACNHKPEVDAADAAMWRRIRLIPFNRVFQPSEQDPELAAKLLSESDGILTWIMQGLAMYRAQGLAEPDSVVKATTHYRNEMDSVLRFIEENAKLDPTTRETIGEIKDRYRDWCREEGMQPLPASSFNAALEDRGCQQTKSGNVRYWQGIKLEDALEREFGYAQGL